MMRFEISLVSLVLAGCASVAPGLSARENCGVAYQTEMGWREIRAPKERQQSNVSQCERDNARHGFGVAMAAC
jgi:hypothetical protein